MNRYNIIVHINEQGQVVARHGNKKKVLATVTEYGKWVRKTKEHIVDAKFIMSSNTMLRLKEMLKAEQCRPEPKGKKSRAKKNNSV